MRNHLMENISLPSKVIYLKKQKDLINAKPENA